MVLTLLRFAVAGLLLSGPGVGDPLPFFRLPAMNPAEGGPAALATSRFVGPDAETPKRALLLSFAARSCKPCMKELPQLEALAGRRKDLQFIVVDIDTEPEEQEAMRAVIAALKLTIPVLSDRLGIVARRYGADTLPYMVLADTTETIRWIKKGYTDDVFDELETILATLPAPPAPTPLSKESP
jgi:thiol-disulfide isomerase/thioredoxin